MPKALDKMMGVFLKYLRIFPKLHTKAISSLLRTFSACCGGCAPWFLRKQVISNRDFASRAWNEFHDSPLSQAGRTQAQTVWQNKEAVRRGVFEGLCGTAESTPVRGSRSPWAALLSEGETGSESSCLGGGGDRGEDYEVEILVSPMLRAIETYARSGLGKIFPHAKVSIWYEAHERVKYERLGFAPDCQPQADVSMRQKVAALRDRLESEEASAALDSLARLVLAPDVPRELDSPGTPHAKIPYNDQGWRGDVEGRDGFKSRVERLGERITKSSARVVLVVGHSLFFRKFFQLFLGSSSTRGDTSTKAKLQLLKETLLSKGKQNLWSRQATPTTGSPSMEESPRSPSSAMNSSPLNSTADLRAGSTSSERSSAELLFEGTTSTRGRGPRPPSLFKKVKPGLPPNNGSNSAPGSPEAPSTVLPRPLSLNSVVSSTTAGAGTPSTTISAAQTGDGGCSDTGTTIGAELSAAVVARTVAGQIYETAARKFLGGMGSVSSGGVVPGQHDGKNSTRTSFEKIQQTKAEYDTFLKRMREEKVHNCELVRFDLVEDLGVARFVPVVSDLTSIFDPSGEGRGATKGELKSYEEQEGCAELSWGAF